MNKNEASRIALEKIAELRGHTYEQLCRFLKKENIETAEIMGRDGVTYQMEVQAVWDDRKGGNLRVVVIVDDGGWRALFPLSKDFILAPDGSFVGE